MSPATARRRQIIEVLAAAFAEPIGKDSAGFRTKFRKMAADPYAFYRGSAALFYADMATTPDPWADERTGRVWIHGDLHAENFGTYMNSRGELVFDVNDFDEAYLGHFSWDLRRFLASLALLGWQKALPEDDVRALSRIYVKAYLEQVQHYVKAPQDESYALRLDNTDGAILAVLQQARLATRVDLLDAATVVEDSERRFVRNAAAQSPSKAMEKKVRSAFEAYLDTIPKSKREQRLVFYDVKDVVTKVGFGVGSAGLPAYNVLIEGFNQALENDVVLSMKQGNVAAASRVVDDDKAARFFDHAGHRTAVSQWALQVHADPFLGYTTIDDVGYVVDELSPYEFDLDWSELTEPEQIEPVVAHLGRATAKVHCVSDEDNPAKLVKFSTEQAIAAMVDADPDGFRNDLVTFGIEYAEQVREDHRLFVEAFRADEMPGVTAT
jgi:uncharacterized protein (DUF2252 family)